MPALVIIYVILALFAFFSKTRQGRLNASIAMIVFSVFLLGLAWIGPAPGLLQD